MAGSRKTTESKIYVKPNCYITGGISQSASSLSSDDIKGLESSLLGIPEFEDIPLKIPEAHLEMMSIMLDHVTIKTTRFPKVYILASAVMVLANHLSGSLPETLSQAVKTVEEKCLSMSQLQCSCSVHKKLNEIMVTDRNLAMLLFAMSTLDTREELKDQTGAHIVTKLIEYLALKQDLFTECLSKATQLQTSCIIYNTSENEIKLINAKPDFIIIKHNPDGSQILSVGEIESSPYIQMVVAGMGHIAEPFVKYVLGMCVSKSRHVSLYLLINDLGQKIHTDEIYKGPTSIKALTTETYALTDSIKLKNLMTKLVSVLQFIITDYEKRVSDLQSWKDTIPEDDAIYLPRRSERKRKASISPAPVPS